MGPGTADWVELWGWGSESEQAEDKRGTLVGWAEVI